MREETSLNGEWRFDYIREGQGVVEGYQDENFWDHWQWMKATVPGDVYTDLMNAGAIEDPYVGRNVEKVGWVKEYEFWYRKRFSVPERWKGKRVRLIFNGVDYSSEYWLNGKRLGSHEGMFSKAVFDVTDSIRFGGSHSLAVRIAPPPRNRSKTGGRKCNLSYGIDYAPGLVMAGIWEDVKIVATGDVRIENIFVTSKIRNQSAIVDVMVELENFYTSRDVQVEAQVEGENFSSEAYKESAGCKVEPGKRTVSVQLNIPEPKLWFPWDMGEQNLYRVVISVNEASNSLDRAAAIFGIREIQMLKNPGAETKLPWTFSINGKKEFIRGANWTNTDLLYGRMRREKYEKLIDMAREANMNTFRIHGWHIREKEDFYDICNRKGILVWQEFAFANLDYPQTDQFLAGVREECSEVVKKLRNHPSLVIWCGGNEYNYERNLKSITTLESVCKEHDPSRPFTPVSDLNRHSNMEGDNHNWSVWHGLAPIEEYSKDESLFISEFGLQAAPDVDSLRRFIPINCLWPAQGGWEYRFAQMNKLEHYARQFLPEGKASSLEQFVSATQRAQAEGLKYGIEHYRRRKYHTSGCMFWQYNEPYPAIVWSIVDWYLKPKLAYYAVKNAYSPVLVSIQYSKRGWNKGETFSGKVWVVNDLHQTWDGCSLIIRITDDLGRLYKEFSMETDIPEDSVAEVEEIKWLIPEEYTKNTFTVEAGLTDDKCRELSRNQYTFAVDTSK